MLLTHGMTPLGVPCTIIVLFLSKSSTGIHCILLNIFYWIQYFSVIIIVTMYLLWHTCSVYVIKYDVPKLRTNVYPVFTAREQTVLGDWWEFSYPNAACTVLPSQHAAIILTAQKCCTRVLKCLPAVFGHRPAALFALRRTWCLYSKIWK